MLIPAVIFNAVMLGIDAAAVVSVAGRPSALRLLRALLVVQLSAIVVAAVIGQNLFALLHLFAYGVFFHGVLLSAVFAFLARQKSKPASLACAAAALVLVVVAVDAFLIEPHWLQTTQVRIVSSKITEPFTIAIISDLQTDNIGDYERSALRLAMSRRPDMILLAGDYLQTFERQQWNSLRAELNELLRDVELSAPLGVYAVGGNCDQDDWPEIFARLEVHSFRRTESREAGQLLVTGLRMEDSFDSSFQAPSSDRFQIVLGHAPDFALGDVEADLLVAGHTHGGQVRLPLIGPVLTMSRVRREWASGVTDIGGGRTLAVSRGIGMERLDAPRLRFLCRPELMFIEVTPP